VVEKENFVDSLVKREDMLQEDITKDKVYSSFSSMLDPIV
jgi:hypothetical protein